jgi:hypothetical protein
MPCLATRQCNSTAPRRPVLRPRIPEAEFQKINPSSVAHFSKTKSGRQPTTIHHESTTNSPSKNHVLPTHFRQNPLQNNENPPSKKPRPKFRSAGMALPNTNGSLISGQVRLIVEVGGLSNDEVYTNSHRGFALRVIFCHIRKFDRKCHIAQHEPRRENRAVPGGSVIPPACCPGRSQISVPGQLPGFAHLLPLFD